MTHTTNILAAAFLFSTAFCSSSLAQQSIASAKPSFKNNIEPQTAISTTAIVNSKTQASFAALFPNATNPVWATNDEFHFVTFSHNGRKASASFTTKGKMNYCIIDCSILHLPAAFSKIIQKEFAGYSLIKATEIKAYGTMAYQAILENNTGYKTLKFTEDGVEEIQQVIK
ncbi:MAG: hypothetical protein GXC73_02415 [Chitinophagaceae bacterium]|nr:hypothetical protein [Chitinophagaceae bacterium]